HQLLSLLLGQLVLTGAEIAPLVPLDDNRISTVLTMIHRHYQRDLTIDYLAPQANISTVQVRKLLHSTLGTSPKHYHIQYRLRQATRLLLTTSQPAKQIAGGCGFNSEANFHHTFRRTFGCTPQDYRQNAHTRI